jgi:hypothetical protein
MKTRLLAAALLAATITTAHATYVADWMPVPVPGDANAPPGAIDRNSIADFFGTRVATFCAIMRPDGSCLSMGRIQFGCDQIHSYAINAIPNPADLRYQPLVDRGSAKPGSLAWEFEREACRGLR